MSRPRRCAALLCCVGFLAVSGCNPASQAGAGQAPGNSTPPIIERQNVSEAWRFRSATSAVSAEHGMVVSDAALATRVGVDVLRNGGSPLHAPVATAFALAAAWPTAGHIGRGRFRVQNRGRAHGAPACRA